MKNTVFYVLVCAVTARAHAQRDAPTIVTLLKYEFHKFFASSERVFIPLLLLHESMCGACGCASVLVPRVTDAIK